MTTLKCAWNWLRSHRFNRRLARAYPCGKCGWRLNCPDGECHS